MVALLAFVCSIGIVRVVADYVLVNPRYYAVRLLV